MRRWTDRDIWNLLKVERDIVKAGAFYELLLMRQAARRAARRRRMAKKS